MRLEIRTQAEFDSALAKGLFALATSILVMNCNAVSEIPRCEKATDLWVENNANLNKK